MPPIQGRLEERTAIQCITATSHSNLTESGQCPQALSHKASTSSAASTSSSISTSPTPTPLDLMSTGISFEGDWSVSYLINKRNGCMSEGMSRLASPPLSPSPSLQTSFTRSPLTTTNNSNLQARHMAITASKSAITATKSPNTRLRHWTGYARSQSHYSQALSPIGLAPRWTPACSQSKVEPRVIPQSAG